MPLAAGVENMKNWNTFRDHRVRNQGAVTTPWNRFGAHDRSRLESDECEEIVESLGKLPRLHVVGISAEAGISPQRVVGVPSPAAASAQRRDVGVPVAAVGDRPLQIRLREVGVSGRRGKGAHIDQMCRAFSRKQSEKLLQRSGRMSDRKKFSGVHAPRSYLPPLAANQRAG